MISEVPVDTLRKRSKSQKLESMHEEKIKSFELMDNYKDYETKRVKDKHAGKKTCN